jgi:hypothetical protein
MRESMVRRAAISGTPSSRLVGKLYAELALSWPRLGGGN